MDGPENTLRKEAIILDFQKNKVQYFYIQSDAGFVSGFSFARQYATHQTPAKAQFPTVREPSSLKWSSLAIFYTHSRLLMNDEANSRKLNMEY